MSAQIETFVVVTSGPTCGFAFCIQKTMVLAPLVHLTQENILTNHTFLSKYNLLLSFQNICVFTQILFGGLCGSSVVQILQKPQFYLSARLVFSKGCSPGGRQPSKNLQFFNISLFGFIKFWFFVLKRIWFSWQLFWAKWLSRLCVAHVSESWGKFLGVPFWLASDHEASIFLKVFHVFSSKPQFYLRNFMFLASSPLLGSLAPPWEPFGSPWALHLPICMCWVCIPLVFHSHFCHSQSVRSAPKCPCSGFLVRNPPQMPRMSSGTLLHTTLGSENIVSQACTHIEWGSGMAYMIPWVHGWAVGLYVILVALIPGCSVFM